MMETQRGGQVQQRFSEYFERWMHQLETNLQQLLTVPRDSSHEEEQRLLVSKVMNLYKEYYTMKWAAAHDDVLGFFTQPWLTPLENAHVWITGWKPCMLYHLIHSLREREAHQLVSSPISLTEDQLKKIEQLKARTSQEEGKVEREMERKQVSMADRRMVELAKLTSHVRDQHVEISEEVKGLVEVAVNTLLESLEKIMKTADCVRLKALRDVLQVLTPLQSVDLIAAVLMVHIRLRNLGKRRDHSSPTRELVATN